MPLPVKFLEGLIYVFFVICSYPQPRSSVSEASAIEILDMIFSGICLIKIVIVHLWIYFENSKEDQKKTKNIYKSRF